MDWKTIGIIIGVLFAASWGVIIPVCGSLWKSVLKAKQDYIVFMSDGVLTDTERIHFADDVIEVVLHASNIFQFIANLIAAISAVIPRAVGKRARRRVNEEGVKTA